MKKTQFRKTLQSFDDLQASLERRGLHSLVPKLKRLRANTIKLKLELDADRIQEHYEIHHYD